MEEDKENLAEGSAEEMETLEASDEEKEKLEALAEQKEAIEAQKDPRFYTSAAEYWDNVPATINGVLGGFGHISSKDIHGSELLLQSLFKMKCPPGHGRAVDCGAGIGRITKSLLQKHFGKVDLVEPCKKFVEQIEINFKTSKKLGEVYCVGLQDFTPEPNTYDVIWCQWVIGHLTDDDLVSFLSRMSTALKPNGVMVVKENIAADLVELDKDDSSVTRPLNDLLHLIDLSPMKVIKNIQQRHFPKQIFEVRMIVMRPKLVNN